MLEELWEEQFMVRLPTTPINRMELLPGQTAIPVELSVLPPAYG